MRLAITVLLAILLTCIAPAHAADERVDFAREVAPVLVRHCAGCHNPSDPAGKLDLTSAASALAAGETGQPALVPGDVDASYALERIKAGEMPPPGKGAAVSAADLARLERWIAAGADWPKDRVLSVFDFTTDARAGRDWWSLKKPVRPDLPTVQKANWVRNPIDAFVLVRLEAAGLEPSAETDRATYIRRASFDLLGLPPDPNEIERFVADTSSDAYDKLVDRLLASPRYGERWARHWLDVVRFGESNGYETNTARPNAWPYRDWVIEALNDDMPYPRFVLEQLAGDQVGVDAATGFLVGGAHDGVGSPDIELTLAQRMNDLDDMLSTTATAFLGLTAGCARCHDHKFDPIAQRDYYSLQAIFAGVQHGSRQWRSKDLPDRQRQETQLRQELLALERRIHELTTRYYPLAHVGPSPSAKRPQVNSRHNVDRFAPIQARSVRFTVLATNSSEPCLDELEVFSADADSQNLALASLGAKATASSVYSNGTSELHKLEHVNDGRFGNPRSWISDEPGAGWVRIDLSAPATIDRVIWARDRTGNFRDRLATRYKIEVSLDGDAWQTVADSDDRAAFDPEGPVPAVVSTEGLPPEAVEQVNRLNAEVASINARLPKLAPLTVYAGTFKEPEATHLLYRGEPLQKREVVGPSAIATVGPLLALAADASDAQRRVALARWIGSPDNPLSARVMVNRIWHYHFGQGLVKTPSDFGFGGGAPSHPELLDWLASEFVASGWRPKALHRLILLSNTYRQASRASEAALAKDAGNRLLWRFAPRRLEAETIRDAILATSGALDLAMGGPGYDAFEPNSNYVKVYIPRKTFSAAEWRRMVYQEKPRMRQDGIFGEFDCPDSSQTMARRNVSTTALQALNLLNGSLVVQQAGLFAKRLEREAPGDASGQVRRAFWLAFGRAPQSDEQTAAEKLIATDGLVIFCRALYNANEFLYVE